MLIRARIIGIGTGLAFSGLISSQALALESARPNAAGDPMVTLAPGTPLPMADQPAATEPPLEPMADHLVQKFYPKYSEQAISDRESGVVVLRAVISAEGKVTSLKATNGPFDLRKPALRSVAMWTYKPYVVDGRAIKVTTQIRIRFVLGTAKPADTENVDMVVDTQQQPLFLSKAHTAKPLGPDTVRLSPFEMLKYAQKQVKPTYPPEAKKADVTGTVIVDVIIDKAGMITDAEVAAGVPMFDDAAIAAARQWSFKPYIVNGEAKNVATSLIFNFE